MLLRAVKYQETRHPGIFAMDWEYVFWTGLNELEQKGVWSWSSGEEGTQATCFVRLQGVQGCPKPCLGTKSWSAHIEQVTWFEGEPNDFLGRDERCAAALPAAYLFDASCEVTESVKMPMRGKPL